MKSNFFIILISFFYIEICFSKNLFIEAKNIKTQYNLDSLVNSDSSDDEF